VVIPAVAMGMATVAAVVVVVATNIPHNL
jgi:hypothetical protein